jgi:hypothetical protein
MKEPVMLARNLVFAICIGSCLTLACDDDGDGVGGSSGSSGEAGASDQAGTNQGGKSGSSNGGSAGKAGGPSGDAGEPNVGGTPTQPGTGGGGGDGGPESFVDFVHGLVNDQTSDTEEPAATDRQFSEEQDDHGHYLTPDDAFEDLL